MKHLLSTLFLFTIIEGVFAQTWTNPLTLNNEWSLYGIGDPYIMKYRGVYYLYCSTKDNNVGVKCWSTKDFITWSDACTCSTDPFTVATGNLGKSIDGSIFIEDDGKWYFYHAGGNSILGCPMSNPTSIGSDNNLNAKIGYGWGENRK